MKKIDTSYGLVKFDIKFDQDMSISWRNYLANRIDSTIKMLSKEYDDHKIYLENSKDMHNLDWIC